MEIQKAKEVHKETRFVTGDMKKERGPNSGRTNTRENDTKRTNFRREVLRSAYVKGLKGWNLGAFNPSKSI